jgi:hypothetical protein
MTSAPEPAISEQDRVVLVLLAVAFIALGGAAALWSRVVSKLLELHLLLPAGPQVLLSLTATHGAGLDARRIAITAAGLLLALAAAVGARGRRRAAKAGEAAAEVPR